MLTEREKRLMRVAHEHGYELGLFDAREGKSNFTLLERFDDWLDESVSDSGHTVEMLISHEAGE